MILASDGWLSMMLSGLATEPWLTEMVKLGSAPGPELPLPWLTAQAITAATSSTARVAAR